jgi:hypothetical protein
VSDCSHTQITDMEPPSLASVKLGVNIISCEHATIMTLQKLEVKNSTLLSQSIIPSSLKQLLLVDVFAGSLLLLGALLLAEDIHVPSN